MKKQMLILAGAALILASCGSNNNNNAQNNQAQMDSIAKANQALQDELNKKKNDSTINAMAAAKADSIEKATKSTAEHHTGGKTHGEKPTPPPPPPPPPPPGGLKGHSDQSQTQQQNTGQKPSGGGLRSHSDQNQGH